MECTSDSEEIFILHKVINKN